MNKVQIRGWTSEDGWWLGSHDKLRTSHTFKNYGIRAKLFCLYVKTFYQYFAVEIIKEKDLQDE